MFSDYRYCLINIVCAIRHLHIKGIGELMFVDHVDLRPIDQLGPHVAENVPGVRDVENKLRIPTVYWPEEPDRRSGSE